jgi:small subunit ribosomal protein S9
MNIEDMENNIEEKDKEPSVVESQASKEPEQVKETPAPVSAKPSRSKSSSKSEPAQQTIWATGRRKEAIARVRLIPGTGSISVNDKPYDSYFPQESLRLSIRQPLLVTHQLGKYNVNSIIDGGGLTGQAGALRLGIARALVRLDPALKSSLRGAGLLTRDPREKERKKYGQKGARKRFQWTKR